MMFNQKFVSAIKSNGKVLREFNKDTVYLKYGSEFSILLKNLNTVRALVNVTIDGNDVTGGGLVVGPKQEIDLERFIKDLNKGNRFKFIERTDRIERHRGIGAEDGIVRVEFQYEWRNSLWPYGTTTWPHSNIYDTALYKSTGVSAGADSGILRATSVAAGVATSCAYVSQASLQNATLTTSVNDAGITVAGSESNQVFVNVAAFPMEAESHVMVFKLLGETSDNLAIREPVTVKAKQECMTCGKINRATSKFCGECGTSLVVYA